MAKRQKAAKALQDDPEHNGRSNSDHNPEPPQREPQRIRKGLSPEQRSLIQNLIHDHPSATDTEIAAMANVSRSSVMRIRDRISSPDEEVTEQYGRRLAKRLPMAKRVRLWAQLAQGRVDPRHAFVQKAALQRVEELIGHVTAKEKRDAEKDSVAPGPIFVFAPGSLPSAAPVLTSTPVDVEVQPSVPQDERDRSST